MLKRSKFNMLFESVMRIVTEGGNLFPNAVSIPKENIQPTLDKIKKLVFEPLGIADDCWTAEIGSTGKKDVSGDIDMAVNFKEAAERLRKERERVY